MPSVRVSVPHKLGQAEAMSRMQGFLAGLRERYKDTLKDFEERIDGNRGDFSFKTMGMKVKGDVAVEENDVTVNCDLPMAAMMIKGRIESEIREQLQRRLA